MSPRLERHLAGAVESHRGLWAMLDELGEAVDPARPSLLPGWTVGHVLTHLARNADSMTRVLVAAGEARADLRTHRERGRGHR